MWEEIKTLDQAIEARNTLDRDYWEKSDSLTDLFEKLLDED